MSMLATVLLLGAAAPFLISRPDLDPDAMEGARWQSAGGSGGRPDDLEGPPAVPCERRRFEGGMPSAEALAAAILEATRAGDPKALEAVRITSPEFAEILWPQLAEAWPFAPLQGRDAYALLNQSCTEGMHQGLRDWGGKELRMERVSHEVCASGFAPLKLYYGVRIHARTAQEQQVELTFVESFAECEGRWKVYTFGCR
jgi:hypothetical protein